MRYISAAFTGYRTEKIPFDNNIKNMQELKEKLSSVIKDAAYSGIKYFTSGVCRGCDLIAADAVLSLRDELKIELWCAVPFKSHRSTIPYNELDLYDKVISQSNGVVVLNKEDNVPASDRGFLYNERNKFMLQHCDLLIAVCKENDILPGGTKNTVDMAKRTGKKIIYVL